MEFWVGVTDNSWYEFLKQNQPDEVNFWQPSGTPPFKKQIELFLFKLHSPLNYIAGGGYFVMYTRLPVSMAWEAFGIKNGVESHAKLQNIILHYRESRGRHNAIDPEIGCSVLTEPFFFDREDWIPIPPDWKPNIVRGKMYSTNTDLGADLYRDVKLRLQKQSLLSPEEKKPAQIEKSQSVSEQRYGSEYLTQTRLGQGSFRVLVTDAYSRRCAMTGEKTLPALEAAHIQSYADSGPHSTNNGMLLRADLHRLFDRNYITITTDFKIEVSRRIHEEFENGRDYYRLHGQNLAVIPERERDRPSRQYIEWHNDKFRS
jgi:putative restriction endonuclease